MTAICIICEGSTEVEFVKKCLVPYLVNHGRSAYPIPIQAPSGNHRGGRVTVERLAKFISHQYRSGNRITTLVDFYGFQDANGRSCEELQENIRLAVKQCTTGADDRFLLQ